MKKDKTGAIVMFFAGLLIIFMAWFIYTQFETKSGSYQSSRLEDVNRLVKLLGKLPTAVIIASIGLLISFFALKKLVKKI